MAPLALEAVLLSWRQPSLSHGAVDDVPLNPVAAWASKRSQVLASQVLASQVLASQVLARRARLDRRQLRWRTASRALWALVLYVEHVLPPSVRRSGLFGKPTGRARFEGDRCDDAYFNVIALGAFEQPAFETNWPW